MVVAGLALALAAPVHAGDTADAPYVLRLDLAADIRDLGSDDPFVSDPAAEHLAALGTIALPALATALQREPPATRVGVVAVLQDIAGERATQLLIAAAGDTDPDVRADALLALGLRNARAAQPVVEAHLSDPAPRVLRSAALACHALCSSPAALDRLVQIAMRGTQVLAAQQSLRTIVAGGDAERAGAARAAIERQALPALADAQSDVATRTNAAMLAALIGRREAVPVLAGAMSQAPRALARSTAALALGGIADPSAVAPLATAARGSDAALRDAACLSLDRLRARDVAGAAAAAAPCPTPKPRGG